MVKGINATYTMIHNAELFAVNYVKNVKYKDKNLVSTGSIEYPYLVYENNNEREVIFIITKCATYIPNLSHSDKYYEFKKKFKNIRKEFLNAARRLNAKPFVCVVTLNYFTTFCAGKDSGYYDAGYSVYDYEFKDIDDDDLLIEEREEESMIIENNILKKCTCQKEIRIPDGAGIKTLFGVMEANDIKDGRFEQDAFYHSLNWNKKLEALYISDDVEVIGEKAFDNATVLKNVRMSKNLREIRMSGFLNCSSLKTIDLPDTIVKIGQWAFDCIDNLEIFYHGNEEQFKKIHFGSEWCKEGTIIHCFDKELKVMKDGKFQKSN